MAVSRSPVEFLMRKGLIEETFSPAPRLDVGALLVNTIPLADPPLASQRVLRQYDLHADRGLTRPWPNQDLE